MKRAGWFFALLISLSRIGASQQAQTATAFRPGGRVLLDAHNCYPYGEWWNDRIYRALSTGTPLAIEQDLAWYKDPRTGREWSVLSHSPTATGSEPTLREYLFERIRPIVESSLKEGGRGNEPLITLNLYFNTEEAEHLRAIGCLRSE